MDWAIDITLKNRQILERFCNDLSLEQLNTIPLGFKNNILWNIGHLIATQQGLVYGLSGLPLLIDATFIDQFRKGSSPKKTYSAEDLETVKSLLFEPLYQTRTDYRLGLFKSFSPYTTSTNSTIKNVEEAIEFNNFHEGIHLGYILALRKLI